MNEVMTNRTMGKIIWIILLLSINASSVLSQPLDQIVSHKLGANETQGIKEVKFSDLDGDGNKDIIFSTALELKWMRNLGNGEFDEPVLVTHSTSRITTFDAGDLDNDGDEDISWVVLTPIRRNIVSMVANNGDGSFTEPRIILEELGDILGIQDLEIFPSTKNGVNYLYITDVYYSAGFHQFKIDQDTVTRHDFDFGLQDVDWLGAMVETDFNNDGLTDILMHNYGSSMAKIGIFMADSSGYTYEQLGQPQMGAYNQAVIFDVDNDGGKDILASYFNRQQFPDDSLDYLYLYAEGAEAPETQIAVIPELVTGTHLNPFNNISPADVDGDGLADIIFTKESNGHEAGRLFWLKNQGDYTFGEPEPFMESVSYIDHLVTEDVDGDGNLDVLGSSSVSGQIILFLNSGVSSGFKEMKVLVDPTVKAPLQALISDFNNDGVEDIIISSGYSSDGISFYEGNGDFTFNEPVVIDSSYYRWQTIQHADINGDGNEDLIAVSMISKGIVSYETEYTFTLKWYKNEGNGSFLSAQEIAVVKSTYSISRLLIGDIEGDGDEDILFAYLDSDGPRTLTQVLANDGNGAFSLVTETPVLSISDDSQFLNFDVDAADELVGVTDWITSEGRNISYFYGLYVESLENVQQEDSAALIQQITVAEKDVFDVSFDLGDVDGDQITDFIVGTSSDPYDRYTGVSNLKLIQRRGAEEVVLTAVDDAVLDFRQLELVDVDGDQDLDLLAEVGRYTHPNELDKIYRSALIWYENDGSGTFSKQDSIVTGIPGAGVMYSSDLNKDGNADLLSIRHMDGNVIMYSGADIRTLTFIETAMTDSPHQVSLSQNYPNPFNPSTVISYQLPVSSTVRLSVFDVLGREVAVLVDERMTAGTHQINFDGAALASGVYLYRLEVGNQVQSRKMVLIK